MKTKLFGEVLVKVCPACGGTETGRGNIHVQFGLDRSRVDRLNKYCKECCRIRAALGYIKRKVNL